MRTVARLLLIALTAIAASLMGVGAASAQITKTTDAEGDVYAISIDDETEDFGPSSNVSNDIASLQVTHAPKQVRLRLTGTDLRKSSGMVQYYIRTGSGPRWLYQSLGAAADLPRFIITNDNGRPIRCRGVEHSVNRETEVARVAIPRYCLNRPQAIKLAAFTVGFNSKGTEFFVDDALTEGMPQNDEPGFTPWIKRG